MEILFFVSNSRGLKTPQTKFELPVAEDNGKVTFLSDLHLCPEALIYVLNIFKIPESKLTKLDF